MEFGKKLKALRTQKKLTQNKLSEISGISESAIRKYEKGDRQPKAEQLAKLASALGVEPSDILDPFADEELYNKIKAEKHSVILNELRDSGNYVLNLIVDQMQYLATSINERLNNLPQDNQDPKFIELMNKLETTFFILNDLDRLIESEDETEKIDILNNINKSCLWSSAGIYLNSFNNESDKEGE